MSLLLLNNAWIQDGSTNSEFNVSPSFKLLLRRTRISNNSVNSAKSYAHTWSWLQVADTLEPRYSKEVTNVLLQVHTACMLPYRTT
jgi:hypothetical protein